MINVKLRSSLKKLCLPENNDVLNAHSLYSSSVKKYLLIYFCCSKWQLCHHSIPFGPLFWCQIVVEEEKVESEMLLNQDSPTETGVCKNTVMKYLVNFIC